MKNGTILCYEELFKSRCKKLVKDGMCLEELNNYDNFKDIMSEEVFKIIIKGKHNRQQKRCRAKNELKKIFLLRDYLKKENKESHIVFITISPNDETLNKKENTYIRNIHKWLKKHFLYTILNKDYGSKSEREHYHATAITTEDIEQLFHENGKPKLSKTGYPIYEFKIKDFAKIMKTKKRQFEPTLNIIDLKKDSIDKTVNYLLKLQNHSNKKTAKSRIRIIKSPLMRLVELRHNK